MLLIISFCINAQDAPSLVDHISDDDDNDCKPAAREVPAKNDDREIPAPDDSDSNYDNESNSDSDYDEDDYDEEFKDSIDCSIFATEPICYQQFLPPISSCNNPRDKVKDQFPPPISSHNDPRDQEDLQSFLEIYKDDSHVPSNKSMVSDVFSNHPAIYPVINSIESDSTSLIQMVGIQLPSFANPENPFNNPTASGLCDQVFGFTEDGRRRYAWGTACTEQT